MTMTANPTYLTTEDIAARYDVNEDTARRWIRTGRIPGVRIGGAYRVRLDDLQRLEREGEDFSSEQPGPDPEIESLLEQLEDFRLAAQRPDPRQSRRATAPGAQPSVRRGRHPGPDREPAARALVSRGAHRTAARARRRATVAHHPV